MRAELIDSPTYGPETDALLKHLANQPVDPTLDAYQALLLDREDLPDPELASACDRRATVEDFTVDLPGRSLEARTYRMSKEPRPIVLWLHGGGFVGGHLRDIEYATSGIAVAADVTVVSLNYRLAPEDPFPAGLHDVRDTLAWIREHVHELNGDGRIVVGGQSAGAALAAGACLLARDDGTPLPDRQILCYPTLDLHPDEDWHEWYFPTDDAPPTAVPLRASTLAGLPPTLVLAAGRDSLRDDALTYADRLAQDGVPTRLVEYADTMHAFLNFPGVLSAGRHAVELIGAELRDLSGRRGE
ncbi:alpha/beta hydrolase [Kribbella sp. NPDC054772]